MIYQNFEVSQADCPPPCTTARTISHYRRCSRAVIASVLSPIIWPSPYVIDLEPIMAVFLLVLHLPCTVRSSSKYKIPQLRSQLSFLRLPHFQKRAKVDIVRITYRNIALSIRDNTVSAKSRYSNGCQYQNIHHSLLTFHFCPCYRCKLST